MVNMAGVVEEVELEHLAKWFEDLAGSALAQGHAALLSGGYEVPLKRCRQLIVKETRDNFQNSHDPEGRPWLPVKMRVRGDVSKAKPLLDRGLLRASIVTAGRGHVEELTPTSLRFGTNLEYAATHQYGDPDRRPVNAKALAIPLTTAAYRSKSPRNFGKPLELRWPFLVEMKMKGRGKARAPTPVQQYLLRRSVTIPARPFLGISPKMQEGFDQIFADWAVQQMAKGGSGGYHVPEPPGPEGD